jgi:hypothetical protein
MPNGSPLGCGGFCRNPTGNSITSYVYGIIDGIAGGAQIKLEAAACDGRLRGIGVRLFVSGFLAVTPVGQGSDRVGQFAGNHRW